MGWGVKGKAKKHEKMVIYMHQPGSKEERLTSVGQAAQQSLERKAGPSEATCHRVKLWMGWRGFRVTAVLPFPCQISLMAPLQEAHGKTFALPPSLFPISITSGSFAQAAQLYVPHTALQEGKTDPKQQRHPPFPQPAQTTLQRPRNNTRCVSSSL